MPTIRAAFILAVFVAVTLVLIPFQWLLLALKLPARRTFPHRYHRFVARLFGIHIKVQGTPPQKATLLLANHSSWLDIVIFSAVAPLSFVAKSEVGTWPFFGTLARLQRTVFVTRTRRSETGRHVRTKKGEKLVGVSAVPMHLKREVESTSLHGG